MILHGYDLDATSRLSESFPTTSARKCREARLERAASTLVLALQENPAYPLANRFLASCYAHLGRFNEARTVVDRLRLITPLVVPEVTNYRDPRHSEQFLSGLRLAAGDAL